MAHKYSVTPKQIQFINADADEVLYGGAAGGGKSYAQLIDAMIYAGRYPGSRQLILRRTFTALERSLIPLAISLFPRGLATYKSSTRKWVWCNGKSGSVIEFGYLDSDNDVLNYQSAEYDVIRFDELTHFTEYMYTYMFSRLRGATPFPRQVKSSTNPGSVGHAWVKKRFIDPAPPLVKWDAKVDEKDKTPNAETVSRIFIPALATDNIFLMKNDPNYITRLKMGSERDRKALLDGDWNIFEGQFFSEFEPKKHVIKPFALPDYWQRYISIDYGMDMFAAYFISVNDYGDADVYREIYQPGLIASQAAKMLRAAIDDEGLTDYTALAPPDLWNRRQETGRNVVHYFADEDIYLRKSSNDRVTGWMAVREMLAERPDEFGGTVPKMRVFENCVNLIRTLPALQYNKKNASDAANEPHELTHAPDALRGFCTHWVNPSTRPVEKDPDERTYDDEFDEMFGEDNVW